MYKNWVLLVTLAVLGYVIWVSEDFKIIAAGVAIFLFGMLFLEQGFTAFTGGVLEKLLQRSTSNLWKSHAFGVVSTSLMQSSSLVSVITISFLSAGLIDLLAGVGIIFGANIGTTTGAWLMAGFGMKVKISAYAMPMIVFGLVLVFQKKKELKGIGNILAGLGFLFLGIHYMKEGFEAYRESFDLAQYAVGGYAGVLLFAAIGILATVVMQSSHATLMLIIAGLAAGQITYENALALAIGANIGTTITAILGSISANIAGKRLAMAHLVFNTVTAVIAIALIPQFRWMVDEISMFVGIAQDDWTLKLAVFHSLFNVVGVLVMIPFISLLVQFLEKRITVRYKTAREKELGIQPQYLNDSAMLLPDTALEVLIKETAHLFDNAFELIAHGLNLHRMDILMGRSLDEIVANTRESMDVDVVKKYYDGIKQLYGAIIEFITRASSQGQYTESQLDQFYSIRIVCRHLAEIIKSISIIRDNVNEYMMSDNEPMKQEYNAIRKNIASILRKIFRIRDSKDETLIFVTLKEMKEDLKESDILANGTLDRLVREQAITPAMATSLMNDSDYAHNIGKMLIEIAERMITAEGTDLKALEKELLLEESDFSEVTV
ncbi:MAG: Na/Pi cotransporter family protein [Rhodothermales bacterium]